MLNSLKLEWAYEALKMAQNLSDWQFCSACRVMHPTVVYGSISYLVCPECPPEMIYMQPTRGACMSNKAARALKSAINAAPLPEFYRSLFGIFDREISVRFNFIQVPHTEHWDSVEILEGGNGRERLFRNEMTLVVDAERGMLCVEEETDVWQENKEGVALLRDTEQKLRALGCVEEADELVSTFDLDTAMPDPGCYVKDKITWEVNLSECKFYRHDVAHLERQYTHFLLYYLGDAPMRVAGGSLYGFMGVDYGFQRILKPPPTAINKSMVEELNRAGMIIMDDIAFTTEDIKLVENFADERFIKVTRIYGRGMESAPITLALSASGLAVFPPAHDRQRTWRIYAPLQDSKVDKNFYFLKEIEEALCNLVPTRMVKIQYEDRDLIAELCPEESESVADMRQLNPDVTFSLDSYHVPAQLNAEKRRLIDLYGLDSAVAHGLITEEEARLMRGERVLLSELPDFASANPNTWTCDDHAPGLEVKDIPVGEICPCH